MKLEVLLSVLNLDEKKLKKMNITTNCIVINQCDKNDFKEKKNFKIYSYNERGISLSRNRALEKSTGDILLFCDDDVQYIDNYDKIVLEAFEKNPKADVIFFNLKTLNRSAKYNKKNKRLHFYNCLKYGTPNIAIRKKSIENIKFNLLFGSTNNYKSGEDTLFIVDCLKKGLKLYSSSEFIGIVNQAKSTWFDGYNEKYFFDKGAIFTAISKPLKRILFLQYLIRYKSTYKNIGFFKAYRYMKNGSKSYIEKRK